jgi:hypothetical protein
MVESTPSIIEEDENDEYDYNRLQFNDDKRTNTSLVKNQNEQLPQTTSTPT